MARIAEEEIERLKREVSLERLAEARGIKLKHHGADLIGLCPFHEDHSPSLVISPKKNLWNCLGACRRGGDVIEWVMRAEGVSFRHAVELLREDHFPLAASPRPVKSSSVPKLPAPVSRDADDRALLLQVVSYYHETLKETPEALKYLESRGLKSSEMIERFRMGFANRTLGYRLPEKNRVAGAELRGRLEKVGILRESGHEHFNGSVVIPVFNLEGEVVEMYGRKITRALRENTPLHSYLPGPLRGVWNEEALAASKEIILCEALIDALTFWCAGFRHVTASYGVNGFTDDHRAAFKKHGTKRIYIAYDRDAAGEGAAQSLAEELMAMGMECFRVQFPKSMDANEYALKLTPAAKSLEMLLGQAAWLGKGKPPTVAVSEPGIETQSAIEEKIKPAAKEKISETIEATVEEENVLPLAAESEQTPESAPVPAMPATLPSPLDVPVEINGDEVAITQGDRRYRVLGLEKNTSLGILRLNVLVTRGESLHVDTFDLYSSRHRVMYAKQAGEELGVKEEVVSRDLGRVLWKLEELQRQRIQKALEPRKEEVQLSEGERAAAMKLLRDPNLLGRILDDFERCGMVGEETNKLVSYLAVTSRLLESPLAILVQSSSAAGKSALMEAVLALLPEEQQVRHRGVSAGSRKTGPRGSLPLARRISAPRDVSPLHWRSHRRGALARLAMRRFGARTCLFSKTKNGRARGVPLHRDLMATLGNSAHRDGEVFRRPDGKLYARPCGASDVSAGSKIGTAFQGAVTRAGIVDFHVHDCRHTWATWHFAKHHDLIAPQNLGGWRRLPWSHAMRTPTRITTERV